MFRNILRNLRNVGYLSSIIFGLDRATEEDALRLRDLITATGIKHYLIQWNDGPGFSGIYQQLNEAGFNISEPGKGKNMFISFGIAMALGAESIGLIDADIRTFKQVQLDRLFYPVVVLNYDFSKAYYARISASISPIDSAPKAMAIPKLINMFLPLPGSLMLNPASFSCW